MTLDEIKQEAETFLEWDNYRRLLVTYYSAMLFAQHCAELAIKREAEKDLDDLK